MRARIILPLIMLVGSLTVSSVFPAYADTPPDKQHVRGNKMEQLDMSSVNGLYRQINQREGYYLIVVCDTHTGDVVDETVRYYPQGSPIPVPSVSFDEVVFVQRISDVSEQYFNQSIPCE